MDIIWYSNINGKRTFSNNALYKCKKCSLIYWNGWTKCPQCNKDKGV
jgi:lipopolysaccharide biosynthesis regulator YciM